MERIRRNAASRIEKIFSGAAKCVAYDEIDGYQGRPVDANWARKAFEGYERASIHHRAGPVYVVRIHDREWYEITTT